MRHRWIITCVQLLACTAYSVSVPSNVWAGEMQLLTKIKGCATTDQGKASESRSTKPQIEPSITFTNGVIRYYRAINHQCCRKVTISKQVKDRQITLLENWVGPGCRCLCFSKIEAVISNVTAGTYHVVVYQGGTAPQSNEVLPHKLVTTSDVTVP